jgi:hypothetical protein
LTGSLVWVLGEVDAIVDVGVVLVVGVVVVGVV